MSFQSIGNNGSMVSRPLHNLSQTDVAPLAPEKPFDPSDSGALAVWSKEAVWSKDSHGEFLYARISLLIVRLMIVGQTALLFFLTRNSTIEARLPEWKGTMVAISMGILVTTLVPTCMRWLHRKR